MKKQFITTFTLISLFGFSQAPSLQWEKSLGGSSYDEAYSIQQTTDNGFIIAGYTESTDGDVTSVNGLKDFWLVKTDASGNISWNQTYGGSSYDIAYDVKQTSDGGYIAVGYTQSNDGDVTSNNGYNDFWVLRVDASGNITWAKSYGGTNKDEAQSVIQTSDGGFIVAGYTESNNGDVTGNHGGSDGWLIKLDSSGNLVWQKVIGGSDWEFIMSVAETNDGGFVCTGWTDSNDGDVSGNHGLSDVWTIKLDNSGNIIWSKSFGGTNPDKSYQIIATSDGGYAIACETTSSNGDVSGSTFNNGYLDLWVIKLNSSGELIWQKLFEGSDNEKAKSIFETNDGGFIVSGFTRSNDGDINNNQGWEDYWILKLNSVGDLAWQKTVGGSGGDESAHIIQSVDGGYVVCGTSFSNDGDITTIMGAPNAWIVKLSQESTLEENTSASMKVYPNPFSSKITIELDSEFKFDSYIITDNQGRTCMEGEHPAGSFELDLSNLNRGYYFLTIRNATTKIIKY